MALSHRRRLIDLVVTQLLTISGIGRVSKDLRGYTQLRAEEYPAAFVVAGAGGDVEEQPSRHIRVEFPFTVHGYIRVGLDLYDGIADARELHYQNTENMLLGTAMETALNTDLAANGQNGSIMIKLDGAPDTDEGQSPPFGYFSAPFRAILHYTLGAL